MNKNKTITVQVTKNYLRHWNRELPIRSCHTPHPISKPN